MSAEKRNWLDRAPLPALPWLTIELLIFIAIMLLAVVTRYYNLGARVMSHDESLHTYFSWTYYRGQTYQHNPMMHGPLQFHLIALSYFIFGASDFTARIPAATFSVLTIAVIWVWRRYLGKAGALAAALMTLISPFLLYYGRYTREDPYVGVSLFLMLYSILRYFETGKYKYIYVIAGAMVLHYLTKETSFIYTAQLLIFLAIYFIVSVTRKPWTGDSTQYRTFLAALGFGAVMLALAAGAYLLTRDSAAIDAAMTAAPADPNTESPFAPPTASTNPIVFVFGGLGLVGIIFAGISLIRGYTLEKLRLERSFDLLIVIGTLVLPQLAAFPVFLIGWNPVDYSSSGLLRTSVFLVPMSAIAILIGLWWNADVWWRMALVFWGPFTLLYTSLFGNGIGFFTGLVGSLGYWLEQHGVNRGSQPWYYYTLITIPIYEFLPALASLLALILGLRRSPEANPEMVTALDESASGEMAPRELDNRTNMISLLGWWTFSSIVAFSWAGEKMPWLTFHMALPMVLWGGWAIGQLIDSVDWEELRQRNALAVLGLVVVLILSSFGFFSAMFSDPRPFSGMELNQLQSTTSLLFALAGILASLIGLYRLLFDWEAKQAVALGLLMIFGLLAVLTARTTIRANYLKYDSGQEYIVYAHGYTGVKSVLNQVMEISERTTGDPYAIVVAYDDDVSWPMSWYMRDFTNARFYGASPDVSLREVPAIIVGDNNFSKIEPIVGDNYYRYDYIRMVWPNQDYFNLASERPDPSLPFEEGYSCTGGLSIFKLFRQYDFSRLCNALGDPRMRSAMFNIWLNRDYTLYAEVTGSQSTTEANWEPSDRMRLYVRKDIGEQMWNYGIKAVETGPDEYQQKTVTLEANLTLGVLGGEPGQFNAPRGVAFAPDGSFYVADSRNHRIQHFAPDGDLLGAWGQFGDLATGAAPAGTFNEPWGIAVGPDGSVYVTDTWNHRVQKFDPDGVSLGMWGVFGLAETPGALYGPRGITVDSQGRVFVADTGNKRIVIFDANGAILGEFGTEGFAPGQFSEPVDVKVDSEGNAYVTDTWNQRVQVLIPAEDGVTYTPLRDWPVKGWKSQSLDNKPYMAITEAGNVLVTDPEGYRIIEYNNQGELVRVWGNFGTDNASFGLPTGIAIDADGNVWVTDAGNNRIMRFTLP